MLLISASNTLAECVAWSGVEGFYSAGIARWVVAGCDQEWPVVLLADWGCGGGPMTLFFRPTAVRRRDWRKA